VSHRLISNVITQHIFVAKYSMPTRKFEFLEGVLLIFVVIHVKDITCIQMV